MLFGSTSKFTNKKKVLKIPGDDRTNNLSNFLKDGFEGSDYKHKDYFKNASKKTCRWCEFNQTEYCDMGVK